MRRRCQHAKLRLQVSTLVCVCVYLLGSVLRLYPVVVQLSPQRRVLPLQLQHPPGQVNAGRYLGNSKIRQEQQVCARVCATLKVSEELQAGSCQSQPGHEPDAAALRLFLALELTALAMLCSRAHQPECELCCTSAGAAVWQSWGRWRRTRMRREPSQPLLHPPLPHKHTRAPGGVCDAAALV